MYCKVFQAYDVPSLEAMVNAWLLQEQIGLDRIHMQHTAIRKGDFVTEHFVVLLYMK